MRKFKFLGTDFCPDQIVLRDTLFKKDKAYVVRDHYLAAKLGNLPYFEELPDDAPAGDPKAIETTPEPDEEPREIPEAEEVDLSDYEEEADD